MSEKILNAFNKIRAYNILRNRNNIAVSSPNFYTKLWILGKYTCVTDGALFLRWPEILIKEQGFKLPVDQLKTVKFNKLLNASDNDKIRTDLEAFKIFKQEHICSHKSNKDKCKICYGTGISHKKHSTWQIGEWLFDAQYIYLLLRYLKDVTFYDVNKICIASNSIAFTFNGVGQGILMRLKDE